MIPEFVITRRRYERETAKAEKEQDLTAKALKQAILKTSEETLSSALDGTSFQETHADLDDHALVVLLLDTFITERVAEILSRELDYVSGFEFSENQSLFRTLDKMNDNFPLDSHLEVYPCLFEERAVPVGAYRISPITIGTEKTLTVYATTFVTEKGRVYVVTEYLYHLEEATITDCDFVYRKIEKTLKYVSFEYLKDYLRDVPKDLNEVWNCWTC